MSFAVTVELTLAPASIEAAEQQVREMLKATRAFDGNERVDVLIDSDDHTRWVISERWRDAQAYADYRAYRSGEGRFTGLAPHVLGTSRRSFQIREDI